MDWKEAFNYGLPTVLLLAVVTAMWKAALWLKVAVVEPVVKSHLELIALLRDQIPEQGKKLKEVAEMAGEVAEVQSEQMQALQQSVDNQTILLRNAIEKQTTVIKEQGEGKT